MVIHTHGNTHVLIHVGIELNSKILVSNANLHKRIHKQLLFYSLWNLKNRLRISNSINIYEKACEWFRDGRSNCIKTTSFALLFGLSSYFFVGEI